MRIPTLEEAAHAAHDAHFGLEYPSELFKLSDPTTKGKWLNIANAVLKLMLP